MVLWVCVFCKSFLFTVLTWMIAGRILIRRAWKKIGTALMKTIVLFFIYGMFQFLVAFQVELLLCWRVHHKYFGLSGEDNVLGEHDAVVPFWSSNWFYVHILLLCSAPAMTANINQLLEISMDKAVLDVATPNPPGEDIQETPEQQKVSGMPL